MLLAIADVQEWIPRETYLVGHDHPFAHVGAHYHGPAAPDVNANGQGLDPVAPSAPTPGKGMNILKTEKSTDTNVHALVQALYQVCRTLIQREDVVRRKISTEVVRRRGKEREKRKKRK
jgi:hypothetical protein